MQHDDSSRSRRIRRVLLAAGAGTAGMLALTSGASAAISCLSLAGSYAERDASGPDCTSPVGLCITGKYSGDIRGSFVGQATTLVPTADTPATSVLLFTSTSAINAQIRGRTGTLRILNAGAFRTAGEGSIVDLQTIVGGTEAFSGATGDLRASGTFSQATGGRSSYTGSICLPAGAHSF